MIFLEIQRGCSRTSCPTKCYGYGQAVQQMPPNSVNKIIADLRKTNENIHLCGFGDVAGYRFDQIDMENTTIILTNKSYYLANSLIASRATVFSRVDTVVDAIRVPHSTGYFTIATKKSPLSGIYEILKDKPYAVKSVDWHVNGKISGKSISRIVKDIDRPPTYIYQYWAPDINDRCKIPIIRYDNGTIKYWPCVSDMQKPGKEYMSANDVYLSTCKHCNRYPKHKFIVYFEP